MNNIIQCAIGAHKHGVTVTRPAWLYDYGMKLKIVGLELPTAYEVDFAHSKNETATRMVGDVDGVDIPNALFESGTQILAWLYVHEDLNDGYTVYEIKIPLLQRPHVDGAEPTPAQQDAIDVAIAALNDAIERTSADVVESNANAERAENAAEAAEASSTAASSSEINAKGYANQAAQSAQSAQSSASTATTQAQAAASSAISAANAASSAANSAEAAETARQQAESEKEAAQAARTGAERAETNAGSSASAAANSASAAATSAANASRDAERAEQGAEDAQASATAAAGSATAAAGSASSAASANTSAQQAKTDAETAKTAAESARDRAETAAQTLVLDPTLTSPTQAAQAEAVGDEIGGLKESLDYDHNAIYLVGHTPVEWEQGTLYASSGGKKANVKTLRTVSAFFLTDEVFICPKEGYFVQLYAYSGTDSTYYGVWNGVTFEKTGHFFRSPIYTEQLPKDYRYKIVLGYNDATGVVEIPISEASNCVTYSEKYLPKSSYEADKISYAFNTSKSLTDGMLPHFTFRRGNIGSSGQKVSSTTECYTTTAVKFDEDTFIRCVDSDYHYALRRYSGEEIRADNFIDYLGVFKGTYRLKANTYYVITLSKRTKETITDVNEYAEKIEVWSPLYLEEMRKYELNRFAPFGNTRRKIYAHKGITQSEPENTIPAFEAAGIGNAWGIETDIQATSDGHLICMHDVTVDRTTTGTGTIANMTFAEIDQLRIKDHPDLKVPTLEQYLGICKTYGCVPCMELKNVASSQEMITKLLQTISDYGLESTAVILCSTYSIGYVRCINPRIRCIFIIDPTDLDTWILRAQRYFNVSVTMASGTYTVTHEIIKQLHDAGLVVNVGGVNTVEEIKRYFALGADSVSSDFIATY